MILTLATMGWKSGCYGFGAHIAVAIVLIALAMGFLVCAKAQKMDCCKKWGKFIGMLITIVSLLLLICLSILCIKSFVNDGCKKPGPMGGMGLPSGHPPVEAPRSGN
jgi:amino acid transporter